MKLRIEVRVPDDHLLALLGWDEEEIARAVEHLLGDDAEVLELEVNQ